jgi:transcriptional regulator with XRE-family HTH domain
MHGEARILAMRQRPRQPAGQEPLWREALGHRLHTLRVELGQTLGETAGRAGMSAQYLSEIERGRKDPSSEMIAAVAGALGTSLLDLTAQVTVDLRRAGSAVRSTGRSGTVLSLAA